MDRQALKAKIQYGMITYIAKENGWSVKTVWNYVNGKTNSIKVEKAVLRAVSELNKERASILS